MREFRCTKMSELKSKKIIVICGENIQCTIYIFLRNRNNPTGVGGTLLLLHCSNHPNSNFAIQQVFLSINVCLVRMGTTHNFIFFGLAVTLTSLQMALRLHRLPIIPHSLV